MTNLEKIEKIEIKCIEANKDIVALKFGCEIECRFGRGIVSGESDIHGMLAYFKGDGTYHSGEIGGNVRIIGRQITLEDILMAIKANGDVLTPKGLWELQELYQLGKPLTDQSPEFINFIYEIFYGK